jgi:hypothetical protein
MPTWYAVYSLIKIQNNEKNNSKLSINHQF